MKLYFSNLNNKNEMYLNYGIQICSLFALFYENLNRYCIPVIILPFCVGLFQSLFKLSEFQLFVCTAEKTMYCFNIFLKKESFVIIIFVTSKSRSRSERYAIECFSIVFLNCLWDENAPHPYILYW